MGVREETVQFLSNNPQLVTAGLPHGQVFQADTLDSPSGRPFLVLRWTDVSTRVGNSEVCPFEVWVYDERGDYARPQRIGNAAQKALAEALPIRYDGGCISQYRTSGDGLGRGRDMFDAGWDSVVIPYYFQAINSAL